MGKFAEAAQDDTHSIAIKPNALAYGSRAGAQTKLKRDDKAAADYGKAYELGGDARYLFNRGNCYLRMGHRDKAQADYQTVVARCKDARIVAGAKANLEALKSGSKQLPPTGPNRPSR